MQMKDLLRKYWQGTITATEKEALFELLQAQKISLPSKEKIDFPDGAALDEQHFPSKEKFDGMLEALHQKIYEQEMLTLENSTTKINHGWWWAAASLLVLLGGAGYWFFNSNSIKNDTASQSKAALEHKTIKVNDADTAICFYLPDSSFVELDHHSTIAFSSSYNVQLREIFLEHGRARFEVKKNPLKPFLVNSRGLVTTALGTEFSVDTYLQEQTIVKLYHGKISVKGTLSNGDSIKIRYLLPGDLLNINNNTGAASQTTSDVAEKKRYKNGPDVKIQENKKIQKEITSLEFNKVPVDVVLERLKHFYHIDINFSKSQVKDLWFTGSFNNSATIDEVLSAICNINNLSYRKDGDNIVIHSN